MLSKSLIQLSIDGWGLCSPLLVVWPGVTLVLESTGSLVGLMVNFKRVYTKYVLPRTAVPSAPVPTPGYCQSRPLRETPNTQAGLAQSLVGSLLLSLGPGAHKVLLVPSKSLCFLQSSGSSIIKFCCPQNQFPCIPNFA